MYAIVYQSSEGSKGAQQGGMVDPEGVGARSVLIPWRLHELNVVLRVNRVVYLSAARVYVMCFTFHLFSIRFAITTIWFGVCVFSRFHRRLL